MMQRRATDHRAIVLEVIATTPEVATRAAVQAEVARNTARDEFSINAISAMVSELRRQGMIAVREDATLFVTPLGLEYLSKAAFDRALPEPYKKPGRKKKLAE